MPIPTTPAAPTAPTTFAYGKARDTAAEQTAATQLRQYLDSQTVGGKTLTSTVDAKNWSTLVNAVTYGGYTAKDIGNDLYSRATKGTGGFVSPTINRTDWMNKLSKDSAIAKTGSPEEAATDSALVGGQNGPTVPPVPPTTNVDSLLQQQAASFDAYKKGVFDLMDELRKQNEEKAKGFEDKAEGALDAQKGLTTPYREDLEKTERARLLVDEQYFANVAAVNELENLYGEWNTAKENEASRPGLAYLSGMKMNKLNTDFSGRSGALQAVIAARNGNINMAFTMIDRTAAAIASDRQMQLDYYENVFNYYDGRAKEARTDEKEYLGEQIALVKTEMEQQDEVMTKIKEMMIDPETAGMIQQAGISLSDDLPTINKKMANALYYKERTDSINKMRADGYTYLTTPAERDKYPANRVIALTDSRGVTNYFLAPEKKGTGTASSTFTFSKEDIDTLLGAGFTLPFIQGIEADLKKGSSIDDVIQYNSGALSTNQKNILRNRFTKDSEETAAKNAQSYYDSAKLYFKQENYDYWNGEENEKRQRRVFDYDAFYADVPAEMQAEVRQMISTKGLPK